MAKGDFLPKTNLKNIAKKVIILNIIILICMSMLIPGNAFAAQTKYPYSKGKLSKYPGYDTLIQNLQKKHPNWNFTILDTGLDWNDVIKN